MSYLEAVKYLAGRRTDSLLNGGKRQETKQIKAGKGRQAVEKNRQEERKRTERAKELKPLEKIRP